MNWRILNVSAQYNSAQINQLKFVENITLDYDYFKLTIKKINDPSTLKMSDFIDGQSPHSCRGNDIVKLNFTSAILFAYNLENRVN